MSANEVPTGTLARDARGHDTEIVSTKNWRHKRHTITKDAWVLLGDGELRNHIAIQAPAANTATVVLCNSNSADVTKASNIATDAGYGYELVAGTTERWALTNNVPVYARVKGAGANCTLTVLEGW